MNILKSLLMAQGCSHHQVWSSQVHSVCVSTLQLGGMLPQKNFVTYPAMRLLLRPFWGQMMLLEGRCIQHWFQLSERSLTSQATGFAYEDCKTNRLWERESCWKEDSEKLFHSVRSLVTSFNISHVWLGTCVGIRQATVLIGNTKQAMSEEKSGLVETGLTGPAAMALLA